MIQYLKVKGLNNRLDDEFEFNEDLNIITGANGSGKTTLLKLIWYLISGHLEQILVEIPFHFISIQTDLFALDMERVEPDQVKLDYSFGKEKGADKFIIIDAETGSINRKDVDSVNVRLKSVSREQLSGAYSSQPLEELKAVFLFRSEYIEVDTRDPIQMRFLTSTPEMLQVSMLRFSDEVSIEGHKFVFQSQQRIVRELLTQKYADLSMKK